ncbi:ribosomal protein L19E [Bradyrhizobium sp. F1.13.1]
MFVLTEEEINRLVAEGAVPSNPETLLDNAELRVRDAQESLHFAGKGQ